MRFDVDVTDSPNGWKVTIKPEKGTLIERYLSKTGLPSDTYRPDKIPPGPYPQVEFPQPDANKNAHDNLLQAPDDWLSKVDELCTSADANKLAERHKQLWSTPPPDLARIYGRYLFATLIGDSWDSIKKDALKADGFVDLLLRLPPKPAGATPAILHRLPWELMHGPDKFLTAAVLPAVSIVREVGKAPEFPNNRQIEPKVLFVIGGDPNGDGSLNGRIRAAYEFVGLVRHLEANNLDMQRRVIVRASVDDLKNEVDDFKPSIVHFICHGGDDSGDGFIELTDRLDKSAPRVPCKAVQLLASLTPSNGSPPTVVVLNACRTATTATPSDLFVADQKATPLAVELVNGGIPIVVGMAGDITDRAARLFTRKFYEALLNETPIARAVADGRFAAFRSWGDAPTAIDWAMPTLFQAPGTPISLGLDQARLSEHILRAEIAKSFLKTYSNPKSFCDRIDALEVYYPLAARELGSKRGVLVRAPASTTEQEQEERVIQYGRDRLLSEIAARASRDGHILLELLTKLENPPKTNREFVDRFIAAVDKVRRRRKLTIPPNGSVVHQVREGLAGMPVTLAGWAGYWQPLIAAHAGSGNELEQKPYVLATAMRLDIDALARDAGARLVWLVLYKAHRLGPVADYFKENDMFYGPDSPLFDGSKNKPCPVRLLMSYCHDDGQENGEAVKSLDELAKCDHVITERLGPFKSPSENLLPYSQFLLRHEMTLRGKVIDGLAILDRPTDDDVQEIWTDFMDSLSDFLGGIPSRFADVPKNKEWARFIRGHSSKLIPWLVPVSDADAIKALRQ